MRVTSKKLAASDIAAIVTAVGHDHYGDNLKFEPINALSRNSFRLKMGVRNSHGPGARKSASERHGPWACWHAFRDVFATILLADPDARIYTGVESYLGAASFLDRFPDTSGHNVGSMMYPAYMSEMCHDVDGCVCTYALDGPVVEQLRDAVETADVRTIAEVLA